MTRRIIYPVKVQPAQVGDTITLDRWFAPLAQPTIKAVMTAAVMAAGCVLPPPQVAAAPTVTVDEWFRPLSEPTRPALALARAQVPGSVAPVTLPFEVRGWYSPLSEPTRRAPSLAPAHQVATARSTDTPFQPQGWFSPLSEPPKPRQGLSAALQLSTARSFVIAVVETITLDKWFQPLALPVPPRAGLRTALQAAQAARDPVTPFLPQGWFAHLSLPTRPKATLGTALQLTTARTIPPLQTDIGLGMWFRPLDVPRWSRKPLPVADYPFWTGVHRIIANAETITVDKWFRPLNLPVLPRTPLGSSYQYVAQIMVPAAVWIRPGGLIGSVNGSVSLAGDSDVADTTLRGSTGIISLSGKVSPQ